MSPLLFTPTTAFAVLPDFPSLREILGYQATGLMVVFLALGLIWCLMEVSGSLFRRHDLAVCKRGERAKGEANTPAVAIAPNMAAAPTDPAADAGPDAATLAVIFAAVHAVLGGAAHRVVSVTPAAEAPREWSREGRRDHFSSHRVR